LACLHLSQYQHPLCRGCKTGQKVEATSAFYQDNNKILQIKINSSNFESTKEYISYSCNSHILTVRSRLEQILREHKSHGGNPRWEFLNDFHPGE